MKQQTTEYPYDGKNNEASFEVEVRLLFIGCTKSRNETAEKEV